METYQGKINEFVDWITGDNEITGQNQTNGLEVSGKSIRELLHEKLRTPFIMKEDVENNLYRMFSSEDSYQLWLENPSDYADLELFNFVRPSDYKLNININSSNRFIRYGDSSSLGARIQYTWDIRNDEGESTDSLAATYVITNEATGKSTSFTRWYNKGQAIDFSIYDKLDPGTNTVNIICKGSTTGARNSVTFNIILLQLNVSSSFDFTKKIASGDTVFIPCTFTRNNQDGTARIRIMIDGGGTGKEWHQDVLKNTGISINADQRVVLNLGPGQHILQIWAEAQYNEGSVTITSNLLYYTFVIARNEISVRKYICIGTSFDSGIFPIENLVLQATQYLPQTLSWGYYTDAEQTDTQIPVTWSLHENEDDQDPEVLSSTTANSRQQSADLSWIPAIFSQYDESSNPLTYLRATYKGTELIKIPVQIIQNQDISVYETGMYSLKLSAYGKTNDSADRTRWEDAEHSIDTTFTNILWNPNSGWYDNSFRTSGNLSYATINYEPFVDFSSASGKTIEIEFETEKVINDDDVLIRFGNENATRIEITPTTATLYNNSNNEVIHTNYKANERLKLAFILNPQSDTVENQLVYIVNNGILERSAAGSGSSFATTGYIKIGGSTSGVRVYNMRIYDYAITYSDAYNNYVYDSSDKIQIVTRNQVLDAADKINFDACKNKLDTILISGNLTNILSGQSDKDSSTTDVTIERICPYDPTKNFKINNVQIRKHGQSTLNYPITSMKFWLNKSKSGVQPVYELVPEDRVQFGKNRYRMKDSSIPANKFVLQANYADSSGVHNGTLQRLMQSSWYNALIDGEYKLRTLPQLFASNQKVTHNDSNINDNTGVVDGYTNVSSLGNRQWKDFSGNRDFPYDIRISPDSFPCVVFYYDEAGTRERTFLGQYVFMEDKKSDFNYGERSIYKVPSDPFCLTVAHAKDDTDNNLVWDNNNVLRIEVLESNNQYSSYITTEGFEQRSGNRYGWESAFEMIYPDPDHIEKSDAKNGKDKFSSDSKFVRTIKPFIDWYKWLVSTRNDHTKFRQEAAQHLDLYKLAAYYIFALRFGLVDSMERNVQIKTYDGVHFHYEPWDMDIALGNKNDGGIAYDPPINRDTKLPGSLSTYAYSGKSADDNGNIVTTNWLWDALEQWPYWIGTIVPKVADALYQAGLTYDNINNMFDEEYANQWCEIIYNKSGFFKYVESNGGDIQWLRWLQGARMSHRHWWLSTSMDYYDAMWFCGDYKNHYVYITANVSQGSGARIYVTPNKSTFMTTAINYMTEDQTEVTDEGIVVQNTIPVSPTNILEYEVPNLNTKAPFFVYGANFIDTINLSEIATGLDAIDVTGVYSTVLGSPLKEINIGVPVIENSGVYTGTMASLGGSIRGTKDALSNLQTLNIRCQRNFTDTAAFIYDRDLSEIKNVYAMGSGLQNFFSSKSGNTFGDIELPSEIDTFSVNNSTWETLKFYDTSIEGSTVTMTPHATAIDNAMFSSVPANIHTLKLLGTSCQDYNSINLVRNWLKSIVAEYGEDALGDYTFEADKIYWTEESVGGRQNLLTYDELRLISKLNANSAASSIADSIKGYVVLKNENNTQLTTQQLTQIRNWFGDTVFTKSSSGLVVDHILEYTQINVGGDAYVENNEFYIREGGRASLSSTKFALAEPGELTESGMWSVSYASAINASQSSSGLSDRGISIVSRDQSADGIDYLQTSESKQGVDYDIKVWYTSYGNSISVTIHVIGVTYPESPAIVINSTGQYVPNKTENQIIISQNNTQFELSTDVLTRDFTATISSITYTVSTGDESFVYNTKTNAVQSTFTDTKILLSAFYWTGSSAYTTPGTPALRVECQNGVPLDQEIYEYQVQVKFTFMSGKTVTTTGKMILMKDPIVVMAVQQLLWNTINNRWKVVNNGQDAPNQIRRSDLLNLDGEIVFDTQLSSILSTEQDTILHYLPSIQTVTFDGCTELNNIVDFDFSRMTSLQTLSIQNCTGLSGTIDLTSLENITSVDASGTTVNISIPENSDITKYELGTPTTISIKNPISLAVANTKIDNSNSLSSVELVNIANNKSYAMFSKIVTNSSPITYLKIDQSNTIEYTTSPTIDLLYKIALSGSSISLRGYLQPSGSGAHKKAVEYLNNRFNGQFYINATTLYYDFDDPAWENVLKTIYYFGGDGYGITESSMRNVYYNDTVRDIIKDSFKYKPNVVTVDMRPFVNLYYERQIGNDINYGVDISLGNFNGCSSIQNIYIGGCGKFNIQGSNTIKSINKLVIGKAHNVIGSTGSNYTYDTIAIKDTATIGDYFFRGVKIDKLYLGNTTPPTLSFGYGDLVNSNCTHIYVPQGCTSAYRSASNWSDRNTFEEWNSADEEEIFEGL